MHIGEYYFSQDIITYQFSIYPNDILNSLTNVSVQFSFSVVSNSLQLHEPQHARPPCPSLTAGVYPNPCPLSQ